MTYVGNGGGSYIQQTTYQYVGYGGDFEPMGKRRDITCWVCCPISMLLLPLLLWWLWHLFMSPAFDCDKDYVTWDVSWGIRKRQYCCETQGRGCATTAFPETTPTSPTTVSVSTSSVPHGDPHNCAIGVPEQWSLDKRRWCCRVHHRGCPRRPTLPPHRPPLDPYNCAAGYDNWQAGWSVGKKAWCCAHHHRGCPDTPGCLPGTKPYDCAAGYGNWLRGWSIGKKSWCCKHEGKGCTNSGKTYDCQAGYANWMAGWSLSKKQWCCQYEGKGCMPQPLER